MEKIPNQRISEWAIAEKHLFLLFFLFFILTFGTTYQFPYILNLQACKCVKSRWFCVEIDGELGKAILKQNAEKYETINQYDLEVFKKIHLVSIAESLAGEICRRTENAIPADLFMVENVKACGNSTTALQEDNVMMKKIFFLSSLEVPLCLKKKFRLCIRELLLC